VQVPLLNARANVKMNQTEHCLQGTLEWAGKGMMHIKQAVLKDVCRQKSLEARFYLVAFGKGSSRQNF
jgi:hypothetical protein